MPKEKEKGKPHGEGKEHPKKEPEHGKSKTPEKKEPHKK
jgi:hypothetical protein